MKRILRTALLLAVVLVPAAGCATPRDEACIRVLQTAVCYPS